MSSFFPPITFKEMNMCACNEAPPPQTGEWTFIRTRPAYCDPCYGDISCQYASREMPRWGMPAYVPAAKAPVGKPPKNLVGGLPSFNPAVVKAAPFDKGYATRESANLPARSEISWLQQNTSNPFAVIYNDERNAVPQLIQGLGYYSIGQVNAPVENGRPDPGIIGKIIGSGTQKIQNQALGALLLGLTIGYFYGK